MNEGAFTRTNTTLITDPRLGRLLKNKMHLVGIQALTRCDFHLETSAAFTRAEEDERGAEIDFSFLPSLSHQLKNVIPKSLACATSV